jgi:hypothetical protein
VAYCSNCRVAAWNEHRRDCRVFPLDIFEHIYELLVDDRWKKTLSTLMSASKELYKIGLKHLYRDITVDSDSGRLSPHYRGDVWKGNVDSFLYDPLARKLPLVRHLDAVFKPEDRTWDGHPVVVTLGTPYKVLEKLLPFVRSACIQVLYDDVFDWSVLEEAKQLARIKLSVCSFSIVRGKRFPASLRSLDVMLNMEGGYEDTDVIVEMIDTAEGLVEWTMSSDWSDGLPRLKTYPNALRKLRSICLLESSFPQFYELVPLGLELTELKLEVDFTKDCSYLAKLKDLKLKRLFVGGSHAPTVAALKYFPGDLQLLTITFGDQPSLMEDQFDALRASIQSELAPGGKLILAHYYDIEEPRKPIWKEPAGLKELTFWKSFPGAVFMHWTEAWDV